MGTQHDDPVATVEGDDTLNIGEGLVVNIDTSMFNVGDKLVLSVEHPGTLVVDKE